MPRFPSGPGRSFWKLFVGSAAIMGSVLAACVWLIAARFEQFHTDQVHLFLRSHAAALRPLIAQAMDDANSAELGRMVRDYAATAPAEVRLTIVRTDGVVVADSAADPQTMDLHNTRPEIVDALREGEGHSVRLSATTELPTTYVALRIGDASRPKGVVRVALPMRAVIAGADQLRDLMWTVAAAGIAATILSALGLAWFWSSRVGRITAAARAISRGDLTASVSVSGRDEVAILARSLDRMRRRLANQLDTIDRNRRTLETLLTELGEGVIVADDEGKIVLINAAARRFLNVETNEPTSVFDDERHAVEACVHHHTLQHMLLPARSVEGSSAAGTIDDRSFIYAGDTSAGARLDPAVQEARVHLRTATGEISVLARAADIAWLPEPNEEKRTGKALPARTVGRLLVLTDITQLTKALRMRSDFVSNASHELRTPVAAIRAAVETLSDADTRADAEMANRFFDVLNRQSLRLELLAKDLLDLARIETGADPFDASQINVQVLTRDLTSRWQDAAGTKNVELRCANDAGVGVVSANPYLLNLTLDNLIDNAIKFTPKGGSVTCDIARAADGIRFAIRDTGSGIAEEDLGRVFERFYQGDTGRAEQQGTRTARGTGLGLAIVKHSVAALGGTVRLDSKLGEGTTVTFTIPIGGRSASGAPRRQRGLD